MERTWKGGSVIHQDTTFLQSIRDPLIIVDTERTILHINRNCAAIYGKAHLQADLKGKKCYEEFYNRSAPCNPCHIAPVMETLRSYITEQWETLPDGSRRCGEVRSYPVFSRENDLFAVTTIIVDITEKKLRQSQNAPPPTDIKFSLSKRETQVLELISQGCTNPDISKKLSISINTVKTHVVSIFNKIGVNDRTQAAIMAVKLHLL
jgi:PAS domain S-box-containing protein